MSCCYCGSTERELRPYGPGGADICFPCATETPEREEAAKGVFGTLLDANSAISDIVQIGTPEGPVPFEGVL